MCVLVLCVDGINSLFGQEMIMLTLFNEMRFRPLHSCILWSPDTRSTHSFKFTPPPSSHKRYGKNVGSTEQWKRNQKVYTSNQHAKHQIKWENYLSATQMRFIQVTYCLFCLIHIITNSFSRFCPSSI